MKFKSILSAAVFAAAFISSVALLGMFKVETEYQVTPILVSPPVSDARPTSCFGHRRQTANASVAAAINALLEQDDANGNARTAKIERVSTDYNPPFADDALFAEYAAATAHYADKSGAMKDAGLPPEFQGAWHEHMKAWRDYADFLEAMKITEARTELGEDALAQFDDEYNAEIKRTWLEVLRVADNNGADANKYLLRSID